MSKKLIALIGLLILFTFPKFSLGQNISGKDFWFTFPVVNSLAPGEGPIFFIMSDYCIDSGYIEMPNLGYKQLFSITPGQYTQINLPANPGTAGLPYNHDAPNRIQGKGIHIQAPFPVTVYAVTYSAASVDAETVLPTSLIGQEYVAAIRGETLNGINRGTAVATQNNTTVTYYHWAQATGNPDTTTVVLNQGETYQITNNRNVCGPEIDANLCESLDGVVIKSDKPIAFVTSVDCANTNECGPCDNMMTMPLPANKWGKEYVLGQLIQRQPVTLGTCGAASSGDWYQIMGKVGTQVTITDVYGTRVEVIPDVPWASGANFGYGYLWGEILPEPMNPITNPTPVGECNMVITASDDVQVIQYPKSYSADNLATTDPEAVLVYPTSLWESSYLMGSLRVTSSTSGYLMYLVNDVGTPLPSTTITLNGANIGAGGWTQIGSSTWKMKRVTQIPANATLRVESTAGYKFGLSSATIGSAESFSFQGGSGPLISAPCPDCPVVKYSQAPDPCVGDPITFTEQSYDPNFNIVSYKWDFGDGTIDSSGVGGNKTHTYSSAGTYNVSLTVFNDATTPCEQTQTSVVTVNESPTADAGPDKNVCPGTVITIGGNPTASGVNSPFQYNWTGSNLSSNSSSNPDVTVSSSGQYIVEVENAFSCKAKDTMEVFIAPRDSVYLESPVSTICQGDDFNLIVRTISQANTFTITITNGAQDTTLTGVEEGDIITLSPTINSSYSINGVTSSTTSCFGFSTEKLNVTVRPPLSANFSNPGPINLCKGDQENVTVNFTGTPPFNFSITGGSDGTINLNNYNQNSYTLVVDDETSVTYTLTTLSYDNDPKCPTNPNISLQVNVSDPVEAGTPSNLTICSDDPSGSIDLFSLLTGTVTPGGSWVDLSATGQLSGSTFTFSGLSPATYPFQYEVDGTAPCDDAESLVEVTITNSPTLSNVDFICSADNQTYQVTAQVQNGDPGSYTSAEGTIAFTGGVYVFTSTPITNDTPYNITVSDDNGCSPANITGSFDCGCGTRAGQMDATKIELCQTETAIADISQAGTLRPGIDGTQYILHRGTGTSIVSEIARNSTPEFGFDQGAGMSLSTVYYISQVVGPADANGDVDLTDDCTVVSVGTPLQFYPPSSVDLSAPFNVCENVPFSIDLLITGGVGPYEVGYYFEDVANDTTITGSSSIITVPYTHLDSTGHFILTHVNNKYCDFTLPVEDSTWINLRLPARVYSHTITCNGTATAAVVEIMVTDGDTNSYQVLSSTPNNAFSLVGKDKFVSSDLPVGSTYSITVRDGFACQPDTTVVGEITCECLSFAGTRSTNLLEECVNATIDAGAVSGETTDGNDLIRYALHANSADPFNYILLQNSPVFAFDDNLMDAETIYYVSTIVGSDDGLGEINFNDPCIDSSATQTQLVWHELPTGMLDVNDEFVCEGTAVTVVVQFPVGDGPFTAQFSDIERTGLSSTDNFQITVNSDTTLTLVTVTDESTGCSAAIANQTDMVQLYSEPTLSLDQTAVGQLCPGDSILIVIEDVQGIPTFEFELANNVEGIKFNTPITGDTSIYLFPPTGQSKYYIQNARVDDQTSCPGTNQDTLTVFVNSLPTGTITGNGPICDGNLMEVEFFATTTGQENDDYTIIVNDVEYNVSSTNNSIPMGEGNSNTDFVLSNIQNLNTTCQQNVNVLYTLDVLPNPTAAFTIDEIPDLCQTDLFYVPYSFTGNAPVTVGWRIDDGYASTDTEAGNMDSIAFYATTPGDYNIILHHIIDTNGCESDLEDLISVTVQPNRDALFSLTDNKMCAPATPSIFNETNYEVGDQCIWYFSDGETIEGCNNFSRVFEDVGNHDLTLTVETPAGCVSEFSMANAVEVYPYPIAVFDFKPQQPTIQDPFVKFVNRSRDGFTYDWRVVIKSDTQYFQKEEPYIKFPDDDERDYAVQLTTFNEFGCADSTERDVFVKGAFELFVPNSFSPNGDDVNDIFLPSVFGNSDQITSFEMYIYSRWGELLFSSESTSVGWDGTFEGLEMKQDIYAFRIRIKSKYDANGKDYTGHVNLIR